MAYLIPFHVFGADVADAAGQVVGLPGDERVVFAEQVDGGALAKIGDGSGGDHGDAGLGKW